jgi:hypothetical protein
VGLDTVEKRKILPLPGIEPWLSSPQTATILTAIPTPQYTTKFGKYKVHLRYEVFTVVTMMDVMQCSLAEVYRSFRGTYCLHLQD